MTSVAQDLREWEKQRIREHKGHALGMLIALFDPYGGGVIEDPDGEDDEFGFGIRDGLDGIAFGSGYSRQDCEIGLWCLERLGWAKKSGKTWRYTKIAPILDISDDLGKDKEQLADANKAFTKALMDVL